MGIVVDKLALEYPRGAGEVVAAGEQACAEQRCVCGARVRPPARWSRTEGFAYARTRCARWWGGHAWGITVSRAGVRLYRFS